MSKKQTYDRIARLYDLLDLPFEYRRYRPIRQELWQGVGGRVLDAGVGTGRNIDFYPATGEVIGIDISPAMLARAQARLSRSIVSCTVKLEEMDVTATRFSRGHFDCVVSSFLFCVLDDRLQLPALMELARVTRKGGHIRILEYAYSRQPLKRTIMKLWSPWVRWVYGASFDRRTEQYVEPAGLTLVEERFLFQDIIKILTLRA